MNCRKCGMPLEDGAAFCMECGEKQMLEQPVTPVTEPVAVEQPITPTTGMRFCPNCGTQNSADALFCCNCMTTFENTTAAPKKKGVGFLNKKVVIGFVLVLVLVAVVGFAFTLLKPKGDKPF